DARKDQRALQLASELRASSYRITSRARDATAGNPEAFGELQVVINDMGRSWDQLGTADNQTRPVLLQQLYDLDSVWLRVKEASEQGILQNKDTIIFGHQVADPLAQSIPELQAEHRNIVDILLENRAPADQVSVAQTQSWRAERIGRNIEKMLVG